MLIDFRWDDLLHQTPISGIFVGAGILVFLLALDIEIVGVRLPERLKTKRTLVVSAACVLLGIVMAIIPNIQATTEDSSNSSEPVAAKVTIEAKTILPVPDDHFTMAQTESEVETILDAHMDHKVQRFIEMWSMKQPPIVPLSSDQIVKAQGLLPEPHVDMKPRTLFGNKTLVVGHATLHVSPKELNSVVEQVVRGSEESDGLVNVPPESFGARPQSSDVPNKLSPSDPRRATPGETFEASKTTVHAAGSAKPSGLEERQE